MFEDDMREAEAAEAEAKAIEAEAAAEARRAAAENRPQHGPGSRCPIDFCPQCEREANGYDTVE